MDQVTHNNSLRLQESLDRAIERIGMKNTISILETLGSVQKIRADQSEIIRLVTGLLVTRSSQLFGLDESRFYKSTAEEYREARMCCYALMKKYTELSHERIAELFFQKRKHVLYFLDKIKGRFEMRRFFPDCILRHDQLELSLLELLSKLNSV